MGGDFIPRGYNAFDAFQANLVKIVQAKQAAWSIPAAAVNALVQTQTKWTAAHNKARNKTNRTSGDVEDRVSGRKIFEATVRKFVREHLRFNPKLSTRDKVNMRLLVPDDVLTRASKPKVGPYLLVEKIMHTRHVLRVTDPSRPESRNKPKGVRAAQVFRFVGDAAPKTMEAYRFIGNASRLRFLSDFTKADEGKRAFYRARYENTRGEVGPWSRVASAVVA